MTTSTHTVTGHWIGGETLAGSAGTLPVVNPATGDVVAETPAGTAADVDRAVAAARAAFPDWAATAPAQRAEVLRRLGAGLAARQEEIAAVITAEMGSPIGMSRTAQVAFPAAVIESVAGLADDFAWTEEVGNSLIVREPIGVVGAITPWNFPLQQIVSKLAPALLGGNTMVFKPSRTPR